MSTRTCSLTFSVYEAPSMKIAANRYHWISSHAFELMLKLYRLSALPALMRQAMSTHQLAIQPSRLLTSSMKRLKPSRSLTNAPPACRMPARRAMTSSPSSFPGARLFYRCGVPTRLSAPWQTPRLMCRRFRKAQLKSRPRAGSGDTPPALGPEALDRPEAGLVGHLAATVDPVAEIDMRQRVARRLADQPDHHVAAEAARRE